MSPALLLIVIAACAYLIGSIPFAIVCSRLFKLEDPRNYGSGNPGATNVLRSGNKLAALCTLLGDSAKGWLAVYLAKQIHFDDAPALLSELCVASAALGVFLGHVFSFLLRFKGGKGVATAAGVLLGIDLVVGTLTLATWIAVALISRYSSLAALIAALLAPVWMFYRTANTIFVATTILIAAVLIGRHKENIKRLFAGTEGRLGKKKTTG